MTTTNGSRILQVLMETILSSSNGGSTAFSAEDAMKQAVLQLDGERDQAVKSAVLYHFNDLLRTGAIGLGDPRNVLVPNVVVRVGGSPWPEGTAHVTPNGMKTLQHASRDPINQTGYLAYLAQESPLDPAALSYVEEALSTYRLCCYKATAMLIGAAIELLVLDLRDCLVDGLKRSGKAPSANLNGWMVKVIVESIADQVLPDLKGEVNRTKDQALRKLHEDADSRLLPLAAEFRRLRNHAGHPATLGPVDPVSAHANLLLFPATAKLLANLKKWVAAYYV